MPALFTNTSTFAEALIRGVDEAIELVPAPHVYLVGQCRAGGFSLDLFGGRSAGVEVAAGDHDVRTAVRGGECHLSAQSAAAAGNQHNAVSEVEQLVGVSHDASIVARVQLLLIRHALPLRSEPGEGPDPGLSDVGFEQANRLPAPLRRHAIARLVSSPQLRAQQTAAPVSDALGLPVDVDDRLAEYDRDLAHYVPIEEIRVEFPEEWERLAQGHLPSGVDEGVFLKRVFAAIEDVGA